MTVPRARRRAGPSPLLPLLLAGTCLSPLFLGCAALAPPGIEPTPIEVPGAWSGSGAPAATATSLTQWWLRFDDPLLGTLIGQALEANTSVRAAQATLRQARAQRDIAAAGLLPAVGSSASAQHNTAGSDSSSNSFRAGFDASWELDIFGANRSALQASDAAALSSAATLGGVQTSIAAEVALDYIGLRGAQARRAIADDNLASQLETLQITRWRLQAGLVTELETEQARAATEQTRAQLPALQTAIEQSRHALAVLTGRPPLGLAAVLEGTRPIPQAADDLALAIPAETLRQRADVRAAELQATAALARVAQADAARAPDFRLSGSLGLAALTLGSLTNGASLVSTLLAGVSWPLFDGGAGLAQVRVQQAALDQARAIYHATVLAALKDVEDALIALRGDRERRLRLLQAAEAAANAAQMARQRFGSGLVDFQTVLETQRTQLNTQDAVVASAVDVSADHVRLYKALGGGWEADAAATTPSSTAAALRKSSP